MNEHFLRCVELKIGGQTFVYDGTIPDNIADGRSEGPGLRIRFEVRAQDGATPGYARIDVFNVSGSTSAAALKVGAPVRLSAGYGGETAEIFKGETVQVRAGVRDRPDNPNSYLSILAQDGGTARNFAIVNKTLSKGHTNEDRIRACLDAMKEHGVSTGYVASAALQTIKFPRGIAMFGMAKDYLRKLCEGTGTSFSIQRTKAQVLELDKTLPGSQIVLNGQTGLLGLPVLTVRGVEARSQMNGRIIPGTAVKINSKDIQIAAGGPGYGQDASQLSYELNAADRLSADGVYKVLFAEHIGDTRGPPFETSFICYNPRDGANAAVAGRSQ